MKSLVFLTLAAVLQQCLALMTVRDFQHLGLERCYDTNLQDIRSGTKSINGQVYPLPNSVETFISLVERYESFHPNLQVRDLIEKLLKNFRIDDLHPEMRDEIKLRDTSSFLHNRIKRLIFSIPDGIFQYSFDAEDFTDDEKCALTFMLSHTINDTVRPDYQDEILPDTNKAKEPRENGVVSLHSKPRHAFALGRVLLGIYAAYLPSSGEDVTTILSRDKKTDDELRDTKINPVYAVTIADLITRLVVKDGSTIYPNGVWSDVSCQIDYKLKENTDGFISYSELRGGVDGLLIGRKIQENRMDYANFRLSQILRMYYGYTGLVDTMRTRWCNRENNLQAVVDLEPEMLNYFRLYKAMSDQGSVGQTTQDKIRTALSYLRSNDFKDFETDECSGSETSPDKKYMSPRNIFAILDTSAVTKLNLQTEIIGNLSSDFDIRPRGNLMGVYTNVRPLQQNTLDIVTKNSGTSGCPACFAKYYKRTGNKQEEYELFKDLNDTLTTFDDEQLRLEEHYQTEIKAGSPGKIILYFNFGTSSPNFELNQALWELRRYFGGATILAIGDNRETLRNFVNNDQTDIFTISPKTAQDLKQRINRIPGEFTYRDCYQSTPSREADNRQEGYIGMNKIQYWAMYPQYFLKSYGIKLKFKSQEGGQIKICFSRSYSEIIEGKSGYCFDSAGGEIIFYQNDPCKYKSVYTCDPFYFSIEGKKPPATYCQSLRCNSINDIQFQFEHEGISCNIANYVSVSSLALLFAALMYYLQRQ